MIHRQLICTAAVVAAVLGTSRVGLAEDARAAMSRASQALKAGNLAEALRAYEQAEAAATSPASKGTAANGAGYVLMKMHKHPEAIERFKRAVAADANNKVAWSNLGSCELIVYESGGGDRARLEAALESFKKAAAIDPAYRAENLKMAQQHADQEKVWDEAAKARAGKPAAAPAATGSSKDYSSAGAAAENTGDFEAAAANYRRAEEVAPSGRGKAAAANLLGLLALKRHDPKGAAGHLRRACKANPASKFGWNNLGIALRRTYEAFGGNDVLQEAAAAFAKAGEIDPSYRQENRDWAQQELATAGLAATGTGEPVAAQQPAPAKPTATVTGEAKPAASAPTAAAPAPAAPAPAAAAPAKPSQPAVAPAQPAPAVQAPAPAPAAAKPASSDDY